MNTLQTLKTLIGSDDTEDILLVSFLDIAASKIINKLYPYDETKKTSDLPERYYGKQIEIAVYLYNKRGAEGEVSHSENGITRTYSNADVPESMLSDIAPYVGVI